MPDTRHDWLAAVRRFGKSVRLGLVDNAQSGQLRMSDGFQITLSGAELGYALGDKIADVKNVLESAVLRPPMATRLPARVAVRAAGFDETV